MEGKLATSGPQTQVLPSTRGTCRARHRLTHSNPGSEPPTPHWAWPRLGGKAVEDLEEGRGCLPALSRGAGRGWEPGGLERLLAAARGPHGGLPPPTPARESTGSLRGWWPAGLHFLTCSGGGA